MNKNVNIQKMCELVNEHNLQQEHPEFLFFDKIIYDRIYNVIWVDRS